jgi:ribosome-associated translation inhibitor RaiA
MTHVYSGITSHVHVHGAVPRGARAYAVAKLEAALQHAPRRILSSRLTIEAASPGNRVDAHVNVNGVHVHVHAVGVTLNEATDLMQQRLRSRFRHIRRRPAQGPPAPLRADGQPASVRPGPEGYVGSGEAEHAER